MTNIYDQIAAYVGQEYTNSGLEVSDDPNYRVNAYPVENEMVVADFPAGVSLSPHADVSGTVDRILKTLTPTLYAGSVAYGVGLKLRGAPDHEHLRVAFYPKLDTPFIMPLAA